MSDRISCGVPGCDHVYAKEPSEAEIDAHVLRCNPMAFRDRRISQLEDALAYLVGATRNDMAARNLPQEWSPTSPLGKAIAVLDRQQPRRVAEETGGPITSALEACERAMTITMFKPDAESATTAHIDRILALLDEGVRAEEAKKIAAGLEPAALVQRIWIEAWMDAKLNPSKHYSTPMSQAFDTFKERMVRAIADARLVGAGVPGAAAPASADVGEPVVGRAAPASVE